MSLKSLKVIAPIVTFCVVAAAQTSPKDLRAQSSAVTIPFFANDGHGRPVGSITQTDLSILDNKKPPNSVVAIRTANELPLRLGVLIDTSNSERLSGLFWPEVQASADFVNHVVKSNEDRAFIVTFNELPKATAFMSRDQLFKFKIDVTLGGATALFDAVYLAC